MNRTGGGRFDPADRGLYFAAGNIARHAPGAGTHSAVLVAVNEIGSAADEAEVQAWLDAGTRVFLDSGVFMLASDHMRRHPGLTRREVFQLPPDRLDGYQALLDRYTRLVRRWEPQLWGYVEVDLGGTAAKRRTRRRLQDLGLNPIPVYHPLDDGWDYFDELAATYDRVAFGNMVGADRVTRKRLAATAWERHRRYPDLWIHLLGFTPNDWLLAYPPDSADSATWLDAVRFAGFKETAALRTLGVPPRNYRYALGADRDADNGSRKAARLGLATCHFLQRTWSTCVAAEQHLGSSRYPPVDPAEPPIHRGSLAP